MLNSLKTALAEAVGLSKDALHVHLGLLIFLAAVLLLRTSLGSWTPWLVLLLFELANETVDLLHEHDGIRAQLIARPNSICSLMPCLLWMRIHQWSIPRARASRSPSRMSRHHRPPA